MEISAKNYIFQFLTVFTKSSQKYCVFSHGIFAETAICGDILHFANFARNASDGHIISNRNVPKPILGVVAGPDLRYRAYFDRFCEVFVASKFLAFMHRSAKLSFFNDFVGTFCISLISPGMSPMGISWVLEMFRNQFLVS